jgi:pimeloyl-ACP methyl ester carboxylesterase
MDGSFPIAPGDDAMSLAVRRIMIGAILPLLAALAFVPTAGKADVVYMKDGFALHGKVRREETQIVDPATGLTIPVVKTGNFFIVDDRARWVVFGHRVVDNPDPDVNIRGDFLEFTVPLSQNKPNPMPKSAKVKGYTPFEANWQRKAYLINELGQYTITQRLTSLTPYAARVESTAYRWNAHYLTDELGRDVVKKLLADHPDLREKSGPDIEKRLKKFRFMLQAGWLVDAEEELDKALADIPTEKDRIERSRTSLRQAQVRAMWDEIQRAHKAGRYHYVRDFFRRVASHELDAKVLAEVNALKAKYEAWDAQIAHVKHLLGFVRGRVIGPLARIPGEALHEIEEQVNPETVDRLDAFLTIAGQAERDVASGKELSTSADDLQALAVTGWVMGRQSAEAKSETAERLWASRSMVLDYLRTPEPSSRRRLLEEYEKARPLGIDEMIQLVGLLPPAEPAPIPPNIAGGAVEERKSDTPGQARQVHYALQLPPEYHPTRMYPVLIALSGAQESPGSALARWSQAAARNGYILAAPLWSNGQGYSYSSDEHGCVTELIRDLRRHYRIDSDRVFLTGLDQGATMAFDVAFSHPDLFAGVIPINGTPRWGASRWYWRNAQYLPFYIIAGELAGPVCNLNRSIFENFVQRGFPSLWTIYRGRPDEFYTPEVANAFDWMDRKKRETGFPELGRRPLQGTNGEEFQTMRAGDNRFYWITVEQHNDKYLNPLLDKDNAVAAKVQATIREGNHIAVTTLGIKSLRLWLGRVWDAQNGSKAMIDFDKPVRVTVGGKPTNNNRPYTITPSLATMLEDLYDRGDRQRLFLATIDLKNLQ